MRERGRRTLVAPIHCPFPPTQPKFSGDKARGPPRLPLPHHPVPGSILPPPRGCTTHRDNKRRYHLVLNPRRWVPHLYPSPAPPFSPSPSGLPGRPTSMGGPPGPRSAELWLLPRSRRLCRGWLGSRTPSSSQAAPCKRHGEAAPFPGPLPSPGGQRPPPLCRCRRHPRAGPPRRLRRMEGSPTPYEVGMEGGKRHPGVGAGSASPDPPPLPLKKKIKILAPLLCFSH